MAEPPPDETNASAKKEHAGLRDSVGTVVGFGAFALFFGLLVSFSYLGIRIANSILDSLRGGNGQPFAALWNHA